jgi:hypothetical protein
MAAVTDRLVADLEAAGADVWVDTSGITTSDFVKKISEERQAELRGYLGQWAAETDYGERLGPRVGMKLSDADVSWLADRFGRESRGMAKQRPISTWRPSLSQPSCMNVGLPYLKREL